MNTSGSPLPQTHHLEVHEIFQMLEVDPAHGLTVEEAQKRLEQYGPNRVSSRRGTPGWKRFLLQFHQPLVYILLAASIVTFLLHEYVDSGVIFAVVLINAIIGYIQESKAEKAIEALSNLISMDTTVLRDRRRHRVPSADLVPGDIVLLQSGDRVPADLRLFDVNNLQVDESALTGESLPTTKHSDPLEQDIALADRGNQAYAGTLVTYGTATGLVWATGDHTETGRIAWLIAEATDLATPLTKKIAAFSHLLLWIILALAVAAFGIGVLRGESAAEVFMAAVALAVGAIPEGLPAALTIVLAVGVGRMAKQRAVIRKLPAVETLGSTTVICSDKTGTLTENQMTVQRIWAGSQIYELTGTGYHVEGEIQLDGHAIQANDHPTLIECVRAGVLCNDSELRVEDGRPSMQGDPTEAALLVSGAKGGLIHYETQEIHPRIAMIPFESEHMFRATLHGGPKGRTVYKVGAVETLLPRCTHQLDAKGAEHPLEEDTIRSEVESMAAQGLRVLAFARRHMATDQETLDHDHVRGDLTFIGLQGMIDPPRQEVIPAVAECHRAGVQVKMITGDHATTAKAIASRIGITDDDGVQAITGRELSDISDDDLPALAEKTEVFARVAPEQKLRLVRALQAKGNIVAMTGDGVNDAPALKQADIGIAMGISGTDVAKGAADMVLTDDNFATIRAAVEEGRGVFDNLRKFIVWTLPTNLGEGGIILMAILLGAVLPVLPVQLLWINMSTAILLGLMLVFEPKENDLMQRPPRPPNRPLLTSALMIRTVLVSAFMVGGGFWLFAHERSIEGETLAQARTAVVNVIVMVETAYLFACRSLNHSLFSIGLFSNRSVIAGASTMVIAQLAITYIPMMNKLFHTAPLRASTWGWIASIALAALAVVELEKWWRFGRHPDDHPVPD